MLTLKKDDFEFLLSSAKFCNRIDSYVDMLDLDTTLLGAFKSQSFWLSHVVGDNNNWKPDLEEFINITIESMKIAFQYIVLMCKTNPNYSLAIGNYLGIEDEQEKYIFSLN